MKLVSIFLLLLMCNSFAQVRPNKLDLTKAAPDSFKVEFETSKGKFIAVAYRNWSPLATDRFYHLAKSNFFDNMIIYRVVKDFVAQFGITNNRFMNEDWDKASFKDEPVSKSNKRGTISFARAGANSRSHHIFINLVDNPKLDSVNAGGVIGYPPFAKIISGIETIDKFNSEYGNKTLTEQDSISMKGNAYLNRAFPSLDYIIKARIIK